MAPQRPHQQPMCTEEASSLATNKVIQGRVTILKNGLLGVCAERKSPMYAQPNKRESPFLGLPNELRNEIYRYALGGKDYESMFGADSKPLQDKPDKKSISLLSVCFQIYMDTVVLPFELNTFQFEDSIDLSAWISALRPGQRDAIRALKYMAWGPSIISLRPENSYSMKRFVRLKEFSSLKRVYVYYKERREDSDGIALQDDSIEKLIKAALPNKDIEVIFESPDGGR